MSIAQAETHEGRKLPVIDVSGLRGAAGDRAAVVRELRLACTNTGFFYITGHGVPTGLIDRVFAQSREFFALPMEQKLALSMGQSSCRHGYEPLKAQTLEPDMPPDLKEGFLAGEDLAADHPAVCNDPANGRGIAKAGCENTIGSGIAVSAEPANGLVVAFGRITDF